jgi:precorrin-3B C17-methyltransferase
VPGVTAMLAAAARLGAPLGGDFCAISLSDNLKPWATIERRLDAAADGDFVISLYNPASIARPGQIATAIARLRDRRPANTLVMLAHDVGRATERITVTTLAALDVAEISMRTLVIVGSSGTRAIEHGATLRVFTRRSQDVT